MSGIIIKKNYWIIREETLQKQLFAGNGYHAYNRVRVDFGKAWQKFWKGYRVSRNFDIQIIFFHFGKVFKIRNHQEQAQCHSAVIYMVEEFEFLNTKEVAVDGTTRGGEGGV